MSSGSIRFRKLTLPTNCIGSAPVKLTFVSFDTRIRDLYSLVRASIREATLTVSPITV